MKLRFPRFKPRTTWTRSLGTALVLTALTIALDTWGIGWGLPNDQHLRSYHPDEWRVIEAAERIDPAHGVFTPGFYNYGSLYTEALWVGFNVAQALGFLDAHPDPNPTVFDAANQQRIYLVARIITTLFGVGAVLVTWRLGKRLFGAVAGALAGLFLAVTPLFAINSHYAAVDVPAAFWMVAALLGAAHTLHAVVRKPPSPETGVARPRLPLSLFAASFCAGLAAGTKYNAGLVILAVLGVWMWKLFQPDANSGVRQSAAHLVGDILFGWFVIAGVAFAAFLLSTPGFLLDFRQFRLDLGYELWHSASGHGYAFSETSPGYIYHIVECLWRGMGPLCSLSLAGIIFAGMRRSRSDILLAAAVLPYYLVIGGAQVKFMRYDVPLIPFLAIWAARLLVASVGVRHPQNTLRLSTSRWGASRRLRLGIASAVFILVLVAALAETAAYDRILAGVDVRDRAEAWILANIPAHDSIGLVDRPWFDTPPLIFYNVHLPTETIEAREYEWAYRLLMLDWSADRLHRLRPHFVLLTEWQVRYLERLHRVDPYGASPAAAAGRNAAKFLEALSRDYVLVATFQAHPHIGLVRFDRGFVPEDWLYPNPTSWIYRRRAP